VSAPCLAASLDRRIDASEPVLAAAPLPFFSLPFFFLSFIYFF
jgi:hypothetical protein